MKTIREIIVSLLMPSTPRAAGWVKPALVCALSLTAWVAGAQPANDNFTNAAAITGYTGTISDINALATMETPCEATNIVFDDLAGLDNSVWYVWTAPATGTATFDTIGSGFDTVLAVYTTTHPTNGPCGVLPLAGDHYYTNSAGIIQTNSKVSFTATAGANYYISVNGNVAKTPTNDSGTYVLNWNLATVPSGNFKFTTATYVESANESSSPIDNSLSPSWSGGRVTVTRVGAANGRATVDYQINSGSYTNYFTTNSYGTNIIITVIDTNVPPNINTTNITTTVTVYTNAYEYYGNGYQYFPVTGAYTNGTEQDYLGITPNFLGTSSLVITGQMVPLWNNWLTLTNFTATNLTVVSGSTNLTITTVFSYTNLADNTLLTGNLARNKTTYTDTNTVPPTVYTNFLNGYSYSDAGQPAIYFGTNTAVFSYVLGGAQFLTNYYSTNIISSNFTYITTSIYTNGLLAVTNSITNSPIYFGVTNFAWTASNNVTRIISINSGSGAIEYPTNNPPPATQIRPSTVTNSDGSVNIGVTNSFNNPAVTTTQIVPAASGGAGSGTLTFDDYQMSADITVPIAAYSVYSGNGVQLPSLLNVVLTNAQLDPLESADLVPPTIDPKLGTANVSILNNNFIIGGVTNYGGGVAYLNFERKNFRVDETAGNAVVYVTRTGNGVACTVDYRIDYGPPADKYHTFSLQADSDYATPNSDYTSVTGTLSWGTGDFNPKAITIPINNDGIVEFNEDMYLELYNATPAPGSIPFAAVGAVGTANLTILFNDQPAGAVDRTWNKDNSADSNPPRIPYPGASGGVSDSFNGNGGTVYAVVEQPDGNAIAAGSFISYDSHAYNRIVRILPNGYQDPTFLVAPNSGANDFISTMALQPDGKILIGGNFTSFNGYNRHHIARLNSDGSVDTTFNPGLGVNGDNAMVWSLALQPSGQVVIAGDFTSYNGTNVSSIARLNADGSLDTSFNPHTGPNGIVNAVVVDSIGRVIVGGDFNSVAGTSCGGVARLNVDGSVDTQFALGIGTYNPDTGFTDPVNSLALQADGKILVGGGFSYVDLISYSGIVRLNTDGTVDLNFKPGSGTYNPATGISDKVYAITVQPDGNILIGGDFTTFNQTRRVGMARLYSYGSLDTSFMDTAYNQFAGLVNHYHNPNANNTATYPEGNQRNYTYSIALESTGNVIIGGGFLRVGGGTTRDDIHPRSNIARLIGGSTAGPGNIQFSYSSYSVDKDGKSLYVSLVRTNGNLGIASAAFVTNMAAPGPGIASVTNFSVPAASTLPTWDEAYSANAWMVSDCIYGANYAETPVTDNNADVRLTINNNNNSFGNVNANMLLTAPSGTNFFLGGEIIPLGVALGQQAEAPLTIIDDTVHPGVLGFNLPQYTVLENGGTATITVVRTGGSDGVVQVSYATSNGSSPNGATNGVDYTASTGTISFLAGQLSKTFTIPIINGAIVRPDRTLNLRLYNATGGATLGTTNAALTIINSVYTAGHIKFSAATYGTNEPNANNTGYAQITLSRVGGSQGTISVKAMTSDGTAVNGINYTGSTNTFTWNNLNAADQQLLIPLKNDGVVTTNVTVNLRLTNALLNSSSAPYVLGLSTITNALLYITNVDSAGKVQFTSPVYSVKKYGGYALIPVTRVGGTVGSVDVNFTTIDDSAINGVNYTGVTTNLHFASGEMSKFVQVPVIEDYLIDGPLDLKVLLTNASPANAIGSITNAILNIIDSDMVNETPGSPDSSYGAFGFNDTIYAMALQSNNKLIVGGDFTQADGVPRQRIARMNSDGSLDASFLLPSFTMGANASIRALAVQQDGRILVGGLFTNFNSESMNYVTRLNSDGTLDSLFNPGSGADNPVYAIAQTFVGGVSKVLLAGSFASVDGTPFNGIARLNSDGTPDTSFNPGLGANGTVYALALQTDGKVVIGGDFTAVNGNTNYNHVARLNTDGSLDSTFNPGTGPNNSVRTIAIQVDGRILLGGLFTQFNGSANYSHIVRLNMDGSADNTFVPGLGANDAVFSIALQTDSRIVLGGEFTTCSGVTRNRITRLMPNGTVDPTINFGYGADSYIAAVLIQEDTIAGYATNVPDEKILIGGGFTQYDNESHPHLARIYGGSIGGSGAFEFTSANYSADENSTNVVITIIRTGGTSGTNADGSGDVLIPFATSDGTGVATVNYLPVITNVDFPLGEVVKTITIPVLDDHVITPDLTVNLEVDPVPPANYGDQPTATLTIKNDDSAISLSSANYQVAKNIVSGTAAINIVRQGSTSGTATVYFMTTSGGTATPVVDYAPLGQTVTFAPGVSNTTVYVSINNNGLPEGNRTVTMQLTNVSGPLLTVLTNPANATLTIIDTVNAPGQVSFGAPAYSILEGGGVGYTNAYINVIRANGSSGTISVNFRTLDGTAASGLKYIATNGVITFGDGETLKTFFVPVKNTPTAEGPQFLSLVLTNVTGGATLGSLTNVPLTILNTNIGIAFVSATNTTSETGGTVYNGNLNTFLIGVQRFNNTNGFTTVNYATTDGTATAGVSYYAASGTLTFNPGQSIANIPVQLIHNTNVTGTLNFTVGLTNPSDDAQLTAPTNSVVQILDAETGLGLMASNTTVLKTAGYVLLWVTNSNPTLGPVAVNYATGGGTAKSGVDYTAVSGTLTFSNSQPLNYIMVPIIANGVIQGNQTFNVTLSNPTKPGVLIPYTTEAVTIIETNTPAGLDFYSPVVVGGNQGTATLDNGNSGVQATWFAWTPTNSGEVVFDTMGSVDDVAGITNLSTALGVFTGTNINNLTELTVNNGLYPNPTKQYTESESHLYNTNSFFPQLQTGPAQYYQPFAGPSQVRFNATAGTTYFIEVYTYAGQLSTAEEPFVFSGLFGGRGGISSTFSTIYSPATGRIKLNWGLHPSGVFRFATEEIDLTGLTYSNGIPLLAYNVSETEQNRRPTGTLNSDQYNTTTKGTVYDTNDSKFNYWFDIPGLQVTVTRVGGSSGRVRVGYTTMDITNNSFWMATNANVLNNGDLPAVSGQDYTPVSGTLTFDDSEMSKTIFIPIQDDYRQPQPNRDFIIMLTNAVLDTAESSAVQTPRLDNTFNQAIVRILDTDIDPKGVSYATVVQTNYNPFLQTNFVTTNVVVSTDASNAVFNFQKAHYRVTRDITNYWRATPITVYVNRMGTNREASPTVYWRANSTYLNKSGSEYQNGQFPLQPGSDYATPDPKQQAGILGLVSDFGFPNGSSGSLTWADKDFNPKPITFTIYNNGLQQFNEDFIISLYELDSNGNEIPAGMVDRTTVTILYDDNHPPAGSVDQYYNADFSYDLLALNPTVPPNMSHPGTDGEVYGLALQPDNKCVLVGDFASYNGTARSRIARANTDGSLDTSFNPGSGPNSYVTCITMLSNNEFLIGGTFTSYNGNFRNHIALVSTTGALDTSFNPGLGFNGPVKALAVQANGEILVGGNFTSYNGVTRKYLALLNPDGSLDASFDPGTNLNAAVDAVAFQASGQIIVGGEFTAAGGVTGQNHIARLNADGSFDPSFDPGSGADSSVFALGVQPDGNIVVGGQFSVMNGQSANGIARLTANGFTDTGFFSGVGVDGPVYNITVQTNAIYSTTNSSVAVQTNFTIYIGGSFTAVNTTHRLGFARLNPDGTVDTTFLDQAYNQFAGLPRTRFGDPIGTVLASAIQSDGNVLIGGTFSRVGGGQADDVDVRPESMDTNNVNLISSSFGTNSVGNSGVVSSYSFVQKTRAGVRNRNNIARLIGGATPGPGNVGFLYNNYSINKSQTPLYVSLIRTNGTLGPASVNFSVNAGLAQSGVDYSYDALNPLYWIAWGSQSPMGRMRSDGYFGTNGFVEDVYGQYWIGSSEQSSVAVNILENTNSLSNLSAQFQVSDPVTSDQFYLGGEDIPLGVALGQSVVPLTLIDDHKQSGAFGFASSSYTGTGQSAAIAVTRTNGTYGVVYLSYATTTNGSTAVLGSDYLANSGTMTFQPSDTNHVFNVTILNSNWVGSVEKTVNLSLYGLNPPVNGLASWSVSNAVLRLINPNYQGFLSLNTNLYSANLSAGFASVTVTRTVGSKGTLTLQLATTNGSAVNGVDYVGSTNTLQWNNGDVTPRIINIPLLNNGLVGSAKQFAVLIYNPTLNAVSTPSLFATNATTSAQIVINNDNSYGTLQFAAPSYVVNENGGVATLTVIRTGGVNGNLSAQYATADATALAGTNYIATNGTVTFRPNQLTATINVPILNDPRQNSDASEFYFNVNLTGAAVVAPTTTSVHIIDAQTYNRPPGYVDTTFNPGAGMNSDVYALALQSSGKLIAGGSFTIVNGVPENGLARLNTDGSLDRAGFLYGLSGASGTVYSLVNQTDDQILVGGAFTNFNGTILNRLARLNTDGSLDSSFNPGAGADNSVYALAETFINGNRKIYVGGAFGSLNGLTLPFVARLNNDGTPDTSFDPGSGPNAAVFAVAVYPTNSVFAGKVLVGGAFSSVNNISAGHIARLNADGSVDTSFATNLGLGASDTVRTIAIQSDGRVVVGGDFTNVNGTIQNHLARLNADGSLDASFAAAVGNGANASVSALVVQADNRIVVVGQFTQANGVTRNRITRLLPTGAVDPTINFGDGANSAVNAVVLQPADQMLVIGGSFTQYDDLPAGHVARIYGGSLTGSGLFQFTSATYSVNENSSVALIGVRRTGGTSGTNADGTGSVAVNFGTVSGGTAQAGVNYSNVNVQVVFPAGEVLQYVPVPVMDDSNITPNLTVNLALANATTPAGLGDQSSAVLTIVNVDNAVGFASANNSVAKNVQTGFGLVNVLRLGTTSGSCTVNYYTTTNGTAVPGTDFYPTNGVITFNPGDTNQYIQVPIINNALPEGNRTVLLSLTNAVGSLLVAPTNTTLTIIDTVQAAGQFLFATTNFNANSTDGNAVLTVLRTNGFTGPVSLQFTTVAGTAQPTVNYQPVSSTVAFKDGDTTATFTIPVINNPGTLAPVSFGVYLSNPSDPGASLIAPTNTQVTIYNTNAAISFVLATNTAPEDSGVINIQVTRINNTNVVSSVHYATVNGTATAGINYSNTAGILTFGAGEVVKSLSVPLIHNTNATGDLTFNIGLSGAVNAQLLAPTTTTIVEQDAEAGISFTNSSITVLRNAGVAVITVVCANPRVEPLLLTSNSVPLQVSYTTVDGTATAGTDYGAVSGKLVFTNGIATNTFTVPIYNNSLVSGSHQFSVALTNVTAPGVLSPITNETVVIAESNAGLRFSQTGYTAYKNAGNTTITVYRTGYTDSVVSVSFLATNGTAVNGVNFISTNGTLTFTNGVTSQSFNIPLIASSLVQPNLTVSLQLLNPSNGVLVSPAVSTLSLLENGGSYVIPAGSLLVTNYTSHASDGIIRSNDTVQVLFALRDSAGLNVTNLIAYLQATNGVLAPSPVSQVYGPLTTYGHSVSRAFTFTAQGTNSYTISPTFQLYDNSKFIGTATFTYSLGSWATVFSNAAPIIINDNTNASPYPSLILVSGVGTSLIKATVTLTNITHTAAHDISALVVSPAQKNTLIMGNSGGSVGINHVTLTFDDTVTNSLPQNTQIFSGTNKPTQYGIIPNFP